MLTARRKDWAINIAAIHHLTTPRRRLDAVKVSISISSFTSALDKASPCTPQSRSTTLTTLY